MNWMPLRKWPEPTMPMTSLLLPITLERGSVRYSLSLSPRENAIAIKDVAEVTIAVSVPPVLVPEEGAAVLVVAMAVEEMAAVAEMEAVVEAVLAEEDMVGDTKTATIPMDGEAEVILVV